MFIHESVIVDEKVSIGDQTKIWHWCHISEGSIIGKNCILGQNVFVGKNVIIGNNVKIQNNVSIYQGVTIEDDVFCGPSMVFTNVKNPRSKINRKNYFLKTIVKKGATIGANATIICGNSIGRYALVGAGSVVSKNVLDFSLCIGVPAKHIGWVNENGETLNLKKENNEIYICSKTKQKYKIENKNLIKI